MYIYIYTHTHYSNKLWVLLSMFRYPNNDDAITPQAKLALDLSKLPTPCRSMAQQAQCFAGDDAKGATDMKHPPFVYHFQWENPWISIAMFVYWKSRVQYVYGDFFNLCLDGAKCI